MALIKQKKLNNGVVIDYFKIYRTNIDWHNKQISVVIAGFLNKESRMEGVELMDVVNLNWSGTEFPLTESGGTLEELYTKIKESKMIDVIDETTGEVSGQEESNFFVDAVDDF